MKDGSWVAKNVVLISELDQEPGSTAWATVTPITFDLSEYLEGSPVNKYECLFRCKVVAGNNANNRAALVLEGDLGWSCPVCTTVNQVAQPSLGLNCQHNEACVNIPISKEITIRNANSYDSGIRHFELLAFRPLAS